MFSFQNLIWPLDPRPHLETEDGEDDRDGAAVLKQMNEVSIALELANQTKKLLECPVCYLICRPPRIWQCSNGHLTCDTCYARTSRCPLCRSAFSNVRPFTAEKLAQQVPLPCKNQANGCTKALPWRESVQHEAVCEFATANCPVPPPARFRYPSRTSWTT